MIGPEVGRMTSRFGESALRNTVVWWRVSLATTFWEREPHHSSLKLHSAKEMAFLCYIKVGAEE
jgi:hypothetical protein